MKKRLKEQAFIGCVRHEEFTYHCMHCTIATIGNLCDLLDKKEEDDGNRRN